MSPSTTTSLLQHLSERDLAILASLRSFRLLTTAQVRRLHFASGHASLGAAATAVMRVLGRLEAHNLVARLGRRIGGVRAGSSGITWQLGAAGERLQRTMHGEKHRRRYVEPSPAFTAHTLAVADLAIGLYELQAQQAVEVLTVDTEPSCWRSFIGEHGTVEWLKPDLYAVTASGDYEDHWWFEADLATEHPPVVVRKAKVYQRYARTGAHQAKHGLFPAVVWVVPNAVRRAALETAFAGDKAIQPALFRIITTAEFSALITRGHATPGEASDD
ncbi:replication-relaxation family protein [Actinosynnema sp. NPDC049800]